MRRKNNRNFQSVHMPIKKFWQHLVGINHRIREGRWTKTWYSSWHFKVDPHRRSGAPGQGVERERGREKGVCTTMTTKWQLIETWIINATPHSKMLPQGQLQPPIVRLPIPPGTAPPFPSTVAHCPFAFVGSVERWPGKLPRMLTNWLSDWRTVSGYKTSLIYSPSSSLPPFADRQATS